MRIVQDWSSWCDTRRNEQFKSYTNNKHTYNLSLMSHELLFFGGFIAFIILMLAIDLGLFSKSNQAVSLKQAAIMSAVWVTCALGFYLLLRIWGDELHNIENFAQLAEITKKHLHNIRLIPDDFAASL